MDKISILTYWGVPNFGAWTQAYALNKIVREIGKSKKTVEHLDYLEKSHYEMYYKSDERLHNGFSYSWNIIPHSGYYDAGTIENEEFDTLITGSDSIWTLKKTPLNPDYHLAGYHLNAKKLISYATSSHIYTADDGIEKELKEGLGSYDKISVRDETTAQLVERAIGYEPEIVLDPSLLWNFKEDPMVSQPVFKDYIVVYGIHWTEKFVKETVEFAKREKLMLISAGFYNKWCDLNLRMIELRGWEWLGFFAKAEYIVTSTFHGLMVGLSFEKQIKYCQNDFTKNRSKTLIKQLGIEEVNNVEEVLNYKIILPKLDALREKSRKWLETAIEEK